MAHADDHRYLLDNARPEAGERFAAFAELFDPWTLNHLDRLGPLTGAHVWEVGGGGPSIPLALAERVGPGGRVLVTDIDTTWLDGLDSPQIEVRRHDVVEDSVPEGVFDLVHTRLLLVHLPDREYVLEQLATAVRPGGWLVVEDADPQLQPLACPDEETDAEHLANNIRRAFRSQLEFRGADLSFGRTLPRLFREAGLTDIQAEGYFPLMSRIGRRLEAATIRHVQDDMVLHGLAEPEDIEEHLANLDAADRDDAELSDEPLDVTTAPLITCWGRRPA